MSPTRAGALFAPLALGAVLGCSMRHPGSTTAPPLDPWLALATISARDARIDSLRASFTAETEVSGRRRGAAGVLIMRKPDRFRLRLMLPFGLTALDYLNVGDKTSVVLPLAEDGAANRSPDDLALFSRDGLGAAVAPGGGMVGEDCTIMPARGGYAEAVCVSESGAERRLEVDLKRGTIVRDARYDGSKPRMIVGYREYREVGGVLLPFRIELSYPGAGLNADVDVERYEVNPDLPDHLFQPAAASSTR